MQAVRDKIHTPALIGVTGHRQQATHQAEALLGLLQTQRQARLMVKTSIKIADKSNGTVPAKTLGPAD